MLIVALFICIQRMDLASNDSGIFAIGQSKDEPVMQTDIDLQHRAAPMPVALQPQHTLAR